MFEAEVARGAEWLDANAPGWERKVDLGRLEMADCSRCVLGQTFAEMAEVVGVDDGYTVGMDLGLSATGGGVAWGFDAPLRLEWKEGGEGPPRDYDGLRDTWVALIKERFNTGNLSDAEA